MLYISNESISSIYAIKGETQIKLSNEQIKDITNKISELKDTTQYDEDGNIIINNIISNTSKKCMISQNNTTKSVYITTLNEILEEYEMEM